MVSTKASLYELSMTRGGISASAGAGVPPVPVKCNSCRQQPLSVAVYIFINLICLLIIQEKWIGRNETIVVIARGTGDTPAPAEESSSWSILI